MSFIPNTTPTPNWLYNGEMKKMNETELKVVLLVTRKTLGWFDPMTSERKIQDYISQSQFMKFTGQSNRPISKAIQSGVEHGWIIARNGQGELCDTPEKRARRKVWYQLGTVFTKKISGDLSTPDEELEENLVTKKTSSGDYLDTNLVTKGHSTKETKTKGFATEKSVADKEIAEVIDSFKGVNPSYQRLFGNTTERSAAARLIAEHGKDEVLGMTAILPQIVSQPYAPRVTTPYMLEKKMGEIQIFIQQEKNKKSQTKSKVTIIR